jgi:hypothetical protein
MVVRTLGFVLVRRLLGLASLGPAADAKDAEIAVLRHQLMVLKRQVRRPRFTPSDRVGLGNLVTALTSALVRRLDARHAARWNSLINPFRIRRRCTAPVAGGVVGVVGCGGRWPRVRCGRWPL